MTIKNRIDHLNHTDPQRQTFFFQRPRFRRSLAQLAVTSVLLGTSVAAGAEEAANDNDKQNDKQIVEHKLVVTAQHREQNPQDVPIAISFYQADELEKMAAQNINDLGNITPGVETNNTSVTQPSYNIRGIKTNDFGIGSDPAVAVYVDGVYVGRGGASQANFNDIQRVEILKGPQGTLFGRNSAAGAIHVITNAASSQDEGLLGLTLGNYGKTKVSGMINRALSDDLFFRGSFVANQRDGYIENANGGDDLADENNQSARGSLLWQYSDDTDVIFRFDYDKVDQNAPIAAGMNPTIALADPFGPVATDIEDNESRDLWGTSLEISSDYKDFALTYIGAYRTFDSRNFEDEDGTDNPRFFFATANVEDQSQMSHELRLTSTDDGPLKWTVGATYFYEDAEQEHQVFANTNTLDTFFLREAGVPDDMLVNMPLGAGLTGFFSQAFANDLQLLSFLSGLTPTDILNMSVAENINRDWTEITHDSGQYTSVAFYTDMTYSFTDKFDATFGLRYTHDRKTFAIETTWDNAFNIPIPGVDPVPFGLIFFDQFSPANVQKDSWDAWTPRLVLDYNWTEQFMTYLSAAKGFKSGGFNSLGVDPAFNEENVTNFELGLKSSWFDDSLIFNASIYQYDYDDLQILKLSGPAGAIPTYNVGNADAEGDGFDIDIRWQLTDNLSFTANYSDISTEYTRYTLFPGETAANDLTGEPLSSIPKNKWNTTLDYNLEMSNGDAVAFRVHYNFTDDRVNHTDADQSRVIKSYSLLDARIGYYPAGGDWEIALWGNNLRDEEYLLGYGGQGSAIGSPATRRGLPRMYGLDVKIYF